MQMKEQRAYRAFWEHLKTPEGGEIRRHALVGGTTAALLSFIEVFHPPSPRTKSIFFLALLTAAAFVFGFGVILLAEFWIQRRNPIRLAEVGSVDGIWVCGFRDINADD